MSDNPDDPQQAVEDARRALAEAEAEAASLAADEEPIEDTPPPAPLPLPATRHCANCGRHVVPLPRGNCPTCGRILPGSHLNFNRKGPVSLVRRDEILAEIVDEYKPRTAIHKMRCLHLASAYAQLETTTAGTTEFQRLIADSQKLVAELDATRRTDGTSYAPPPIESLSNEELIARLETLLAAARKNAEPPQPVASEPKPVSDDGSEGSENKSEPSPKAISSHTGQTPAEKESAAPSPELSDEEKERRAAAIRRELGWTSVLNESTGRRYRE